MLMAGRCVTGRTPHRVTGTAPHRDGEAALTAAYRRLNTVGDGPELGCAGGWAFGSWNGPPFGFGRRWADGVDDGANEGRNEGWLDGCRLGRVDGWVDGC